MALPDNAANFCYGTVTTAPSPAASGTSLEVTLLGGPTLPAAPWNATVWATGVGPLESNSEIVRVTAIAMAGAVATLTITRAQESTSARTIVVGDQFALTITAKLVSDINTALAAKSPTLNDTGLGSTLIANATTGQIAKLLAGSNITLSTLPGGDGVAIAVTSSGGDVVGPASSVDNRPALFDGATGKLLKQASAALGTAAFQNTGAFDPSGAAAAAEAASDPAGSASAAYDAAVQRANHTGSQAIATVSGLQTELDGKVDENAAITEATKTKITYDAKGLVTAGADATTADIADSANKRYVTDANLTVIGNTSGTNTGDQTSVSGNAGTVTTNANLTGPVTSVGNATAITDDAVTNAKLAEASANTVKANATGSAANPTDLAMAASTILARLASGDIVAATPADLRTLLALVIGTNVQAYDADLTTWAGITPGTGVATALAIAVGSAGAFVAFNGAGGTPISLVLTNATGLPMAALLAGTLVPGDFAFGENTGLFYDAALSADGKYCGMCRNGTAGAALAFGDLVYLAVADSRWEKTDADAESTSGPVKICMCVLAAAADGDPTKLLEVGYIRADAKFPALTVGAKAYVGTTAGEIQVAQPSGTDDCIRVVGTSTTADELHFNPSEDWMIHV